MFFENFIFSLRRAQAARGPLLSAPAESRQRQAQGSFTPCESPDQSGVLDAPLWKPPSPRWRGRPGRTPRRFAAGASVPLGKAASACALASISAPPPLRVGGFAPLPPKVPQRGKFAGHARRWGLRPLAPKVPHWETFACHARTRMGQRPKRLLRRSPRKSARKLQPQRGEEFRRPLARIAAAGRASATARGNPKGGAALFGQSLPTFCWPESRGPARPERVEGRNQKFKKT